MVLFPSVVVSVSVAPPPRSLLSPRVGSPLLQQEVLPHSVDSPEQPHSHLSWAPGHISEQGGGRNEAPCLWHLSWEGQGLFTSRRWMEVLGLPS